MTNQRLRQARELKGWGIDDMARRTGLRRHTLEAIEGGHFAELPAGVYCRSSIRSYASAVGLDPDEVLESLGPLLPVPEDPLDGLARRHGHFRKTEPKATELPGPPAPPVARVATHPAMFEPTEAIEPVAISEPVHAIESIPAVESARAVEPAPADDDLTLIIAEAERTLVVDVPLASHADALPDRSLPALLDEPMLRGAPDDDSDPTDILLAADAAEEDFEAAAEMVPEGIDSASRGGRQWWRPVAASAIDGLLLAAIGLVLVWLTAVACNTSVAVALRIAAPALGLLFALIVSLYFVLLGGVGDATPGVMMVRPAAPRPVRTMLNARAVFGRARRSLFGDDSLLVD